MNSYATSYTTKADLSVSGKYDDQYKDEDDDLGSLYLNFKDPIIVSDKYASSKGYEMYSLSTGAIDVVIAPTSIR